MTLTTGKLQVVPDISTKALLETLSDISQVKFWAVDPLLLEPSLFGDGF